MSFVKLVRAFQDTKGIPSRSNNAENIRHIGHINLRARDALDTTLQDTVELHRNVHSNCSINRRHCFLGCIPLYTGGWPITWAGASAVMIVRGDVQAISISSGM